MSLDGAGQTVGLVSFDGFFPGDVLAYEKLAGLPNVTVTNVLVSGVSGVAGANNREVALDIDMVISMAPGLAKVIVYEGASLFTSTLLNRIATDNLAKQISCSWAFVKVVDAARDQAFQQFAAQGQSMFQACGDYGAWGQGPPPPSDNPYITIVGGTSLTTSGPGGAWLSESAWSFGGGGISTNYALPSWQQGLSMAANHGSTAKRNIPDVACLADGVVWLIANHGEQMVVGGTSVSAPLWAGYTALANQQASQCRQADRRFH